MNFFEHQDKARKSSSRLVILFGLAVAGIVCALYLITVFAFFAKERQHGGQITWWQFEVFWKVALAVIAVIGICSLNRISSLSAGGSAVAEMMGGRRIESATKNRQERVLVNVVEEIAIASGVPVPAIYVIDSDGINAFAAGYTADDAAVAVTQGCLDLLDRDELQGVMAHEFSHILNGDMRLNIRLMGVLAGILVIGYAGQFIMRTAFYSGGRRRSNKDNQGALAVVAFGLVVFIIGFIGVFFGNLIKAAVSRQREYLADASAVQFTRNNLGIAGALKKIGSHTYGSTVESSKAAELSHMFFANALSGASFATHPPLPDRIKRLEPGWDGAYPEITSQASGSSATPQQAAGIAASAPASPPPPPEGRVIIPSSGALGAVAGLAGASNLVNANPSAVVNQVGNPSQEHLDFGKQLVTSVPEIISEAAHAPMSAVAVVYGLLLDQDASLRKQQLEAVKSSSDPGVFREPIRLTPAMVALDARARLPVLELAIPSLRQMSPGQYERMMSNVDTLIRADSELSLFEFTLHKIMKRRLEGTFGKPSKKKIQFHSPKPLLADLSVLLSGLAHVGDEDSAKASAAFDVARAKLPSRVRDAVRLLPKEECTFANINRSIDRLDLASAPIKQQLVSAAAHCVMADEEVTVEEGELLRAICDTLGAPMPPFLPTVA